MDYRWAWVIAGVLLAAVSACGGETTEDVARVPATEDAQVAVTRDLTYATGGDQTLTLDMYAPTESGDWPVVIHVTDLAGFAPSWLPDDLVALGTIVFVIESPPYDPDSLIRDQGAGFRQIAESIACAIHFARGKASDLGSDNPHVVLTGHSAGGGPAAHVALLGANLESRWQDFADARGGPPRHFDCEITESMTRVDALVGMAGSYDLFLGYEGRKEREWIQQTDPELWQFLQSSIGENPDLTVRLLHGDNDLTIPYANSVTFEAMLADAGYDVELQAFPGGHNMPRELLAETVMKITAG